MAAGWVADTADMNLGAAGVELDPRGNVRVDRFLQTTAAHIFAAGDVTGRLMLVPGAIEDGFVAATNAIQGPTLPLPHRVTPSGSFTHPEYAEVGLTEAEARARTTSSPRSCRSMLRYAQSSKAALSASASWSSIAGAVGFWDATSSASAPWRSHNWRRSRWPPTCGSTTVARIAVSFPTYAEVLVHAAILVAMELGIPLSGQGERVRRDALPT